MQEPEESHRPKSFPFVARLMERVLVTMLDGKKVEAVVMEKSIQPREMYEKTDWTTGTTTWRTGSDKLVGYEVMTDDRMRHYVRPYQVTSLRKRPERVSEERVPSSRTARPLGNDLIIHTKALVKGGE